MPAYKYLSTPGFAVQVVSIYNWKTVIDSDNLPATKLHILAIKTVKDGVETQYPIVKTFEHRTAFVSYLNSTFVQDTGLSEFKLSSPYINYDNTEEFDKIEIMAIYGTQLIAFKVGDPESVGESPLNLEPDQIVEVENGSEIVHDSLSNTVLSVKERAMNLEPMNATGYRHLPDENKLSFPGKTLEDTYVYVLVQQVPGDYTPPDEDEE